MGIAGSEGGWDGPGTEGEEARSLTVTETTTLKHAFAIGERKAEEVIADLEEALRTAKAAAERGIETLTTDVEHEERTFTNWLGGQPVTGTHTVPVRVTVTGTKAAITDATPPAPTDPPA